jgi:hypothetical protein
MMPEAQPREGAWRADQREARQAFQRGEEMPEQSVRSRTYAFPLRHHIALSHIILPARHPRRRRRGQR